MRRLNAEVRLTGRLFVDSPGSPLVLEMGNRSADMRSGGTDPVRHTSLRTSSAASASREREGKVK